MIYANVNLTLLKDSMKADKNVLLYRGDKNVEIRFVIKENRFIIEENTYAQLIISRPSAAPIYSETSLMENNTVVFLITEDMIDELNEVGAYTFQIRLYDDNLHAKATLPPCYDCLIVEAPISGEALINYATVNFSSVMRNSTPDISEEELFTEDNEYNKTVWKSGDIISDMRLNKIEDALYYINRKKGEGGGGGTAPYISTSLPETVLVSMGSDFMMELDFTSPNIGKGTVKVSVDDKEVFSAKIDQGETQTPVSESFFIKGTNKVSVYVLDRVGLMSNVITFYIRYGGTEFTSNFDPNVAYDHGTDVRYYFTPTALDTSVPLTFYMEIDGVLQPGVSCTSDVRGYFAFPRDLSVGKHRCRAWITGGGISSNVMSFNLILIDETSLVVATNTFNPMVEEGSQLILDYKVYMKNNSSFITKTYVDEKLVGTGTCTAETSYYKSTTLSEGTHTIKIEVYDVTETYSDFVTWSVTITESTYAMIDPTKTGSTFMATAYSRTNADSNKDKWVGVNQDDREIQALLHNFTYDSESGWVDDSLIISGDSYVEIPVKPLANNARTGFALDIEFRTKPIGAEDAEVLAIWSDADNCGVKITTEQIILRSKAGNECSLYFSEDEVVSAIFIIDRDEKTAKIYLNGVMCAAFYLSDYEVDGEKVLEDFTVNSNVFLGGNGKNGWCAIKNIRIYEVALTTNEILNNFIANEKDKLEQKALVDFQNGITLPTMTIYGDFSGLGKDDKKPCNIVYNSTDPTLYGESFTVDGKTSSLQYQGTSSMAYPIKNYRINLADRQGEKWRYPFPKGKPEHRYTLKADFMSSGHWQNTGLTKWINDNLYNYNTSDEKSMNPKKWFDIHNGGSLNDTRECIYGFPCRLILVNDGTTALNEGQNEPTPGNTKDMGIFNFNHDKDSTDTMGFDIENFPNCVSFEVAANSDTSAGAFISYVQTDEKTELEYFKESFEMRFPDPEDYDEWHGYSNLKRLIDWVDKCSDEEFVRDFDLYFNRDYTLRYYLLVITLGMVDNLGKNMMLDTWDGQIWMPRFYDCDTICSYSNDGTIRFDVDIEMEQGYWNTSNSRLWTRIRDLMHSELVEKYANMRANGLTYESLMSYFYDEQISKIPQKYYNMDADVKYLPFGDQYLGKAHGDGYEHLKRWLKNRIIFTDTLFDYAPSYENDILTIRANTTDLMHLQIETYTPVYQHLSWYNGQMDKVKINKGEMVEFSGRAAAATDQEILIYGGSNVKKISGINSCNPNAMLIGFATRLTELIAPDCPLLTDINSNKANLAAHVYLNKVDLSGCTQLGGNLRLNNSTLIRDIDIQDTVITGINFPPNAKNLETLKIPETITELSIKGALLLKDLELTNNLTYLSLIDTPKLTTITATTCDKLTTLIMERPGSNPFTLMGKAPNIEYIRLIDIDAQTTTDIAQRLLNLKGLDAAGNVIPAGEAVSGTIRLVTCSSNLEKQLKASFPKVTFVVLSYVTSYTVNFVDGDGNTLYTTEVISNGEAVYVGPTPTKTSTAQYHYEWTGWNTPLRPIIGNTTVTATFNPILRYYDIRFLNGNTMEVMTSGSYAYGTQLTAPDFPDGLNMWVPGLAKVTESVDYVAKYAPYPEDLNVFSFGSIYASPNSYETIGYSVRLKATSSYPAPVNVIFPFEYNGKPVLKIETSSAPTSAYMANIENVYVPETITEINGSVFYGATKLTSVMLPDTVRKIQGSVFYGCSSLQYVEAPGCQEMGSTSDYTTGSFYGCTSLQYVILGSAKYPFKKVLTYSANGSARPFASCSVLKYVNLITENGLESDVEFNVYETSTSNNYIFSKEPVYPEIIDDVLYLYNNEEYFVMGLNNSTLTELTIPDKINGYPVTTIMKRAFYTKSNLAHVRGMGEVKRIEEYAFVMGSGTMRQYNLLTIGSVDGEVYLPKLEYLGNYAFSYNASFKAIDLPNVKYIGERALNDHIYAERLNIPKAEYLGSHAAAYIGQSSATGYCETSIMSELSEVSMNGNQFMYSKVDKLIAPKLTVIPYAFNTYNDKCRVAIFGSEGHPVTSIYCHYDSQGYTNGTEIFSNNAAMRQVVISTNADDIKEIAMDYVEGEHSYGHFGNIGGYPERLDRLDTIILTKGKAEYHNENGIEYVETDDGAILISVPTDSTTFTAPSNINLYALGGLLFKSNETITDVILPSSLKRIGKYCFGSSNVVTVSGDFELEHIGPYAFSECTSLTRIGAEEGTVNINTVTTMGERALFKLQKIKRLIANNVEEIGDYGFAYMAELTHVELNNLKKAGKCALLGSKALKILSLPKLEVIPQSLAEDCYALEMVYIGSPGHYVKTIDTGYPSTTPGAPFGDASSNIKIYLCTQSGSLDGVTITDKQGYIGSISGSYSSGYIPCVISNRVIASTTLNYKTGHDDTYYYVYDDNGAVVYDISMDLSAYAEATLTIPPIGNGLKIACLGIPFTDNTSVTKVVLPQGLEEIGHNFGKNCTNLKTVEGFETIKRVGDDCFHHADALIDIDFSSLERAGINICRYTSIVNLQLPKLTSLGSQGFRNLDDLEYAWCPGLTRLGSSYDGSGSMIGFGYCRKLKMVVIGSVEHPFTTAESGTSYSSAQAFYETETLRKVVLVTSPDSDLYELASNIRYGCGANHISGSVKYIGPTLDGNGNILSLSNKNARIYVGENTEGIIYDDNTATLVTDKLFTGQTSYTVPATLDGASVVEIGPGLYSSNCTSSRNTKTFVLPSTCKTVSYGAFRNAGFTTVTGVDNIEYIYREGLYRNYDSATSVTMGATTNEVNLPKLKRLEYYGIGGFGNVTNVKLPSLEYAGVSAIYAVFTNLIIGGKLTHISARLSAYGTMTSLQIGSASDRVQSTDDWNVRAFSNSETADKAAFTNITLYLASGVSTANSPWGAPEATFNYL